MYDLVTELGAELLATLAYAVGTVALSALGLAVEYNSLAHFHSGERLLATWLAFMGLVLLGFAATLGREKLLPALRTG